MTSKVEYQGGLRTAAVHIKSNNTLITDAPTDNQGKGEAFSPTDLVATALASCMLTIMGIKANAMEIDLEGTKAEVIKIMATDPRRIDEVKIAIQLNQQFDEKTRKILEKAALTCPVAKSLHPDLKQTITFDYP